MRPLFVRNLWAMPENIYLPIQSLQKTKINHFGLCWILFFNHRDVESWPPMDPLNGVINASLVFKPGTSFYSAQFIEKDRIFKEEQKDSTAGPYVESTVSGVLGGNNLNHITGIQAMMGGKYGVLIKERNGEMRLIGSADAGAKFAWDYTSGNDSASRKRNCKWTFESAYPIPIYQGGNIVINDVIIPIGGITTPLPGFHLLTRFIVGVTVGGMINGEVSFTNPALTGKNVWVFADGIKIPASDTPIVGARTVRKILNQNTIYFDGGAVQNEIIEIFIF